MVAKSLHGMRRPEGLEKLESEVVMEVGPTKIQRSSYEICSRSRIEDERSEASHPGEGRKDKTTEKKSCAWGAGGSESQWRVKYISEKEGVGE